MKGIGVICEACEEREAIGIASGRAVCGPCLVLSAAAVRWGGQATLITNTQEVPRHCRICQAPVPDGSPRCVPCDVDVQNITDEEEN